MQAPRILVVEEDGIIARHLAIILTRFGYQVQGVVENGVEALRLAELSPPDLALLDIQMEGEVDGVQVAAEFQNRMDIPVVILTAFAGTEVLKRARVANPFGLVTKPFDERHLQVTLELALQKHRLESELRASQQRYLAIVSQASDGIMLVDVHTRLIVEVNLACQDLLGVTASQVVGRPIQELLGYLSHPLPSEFLRGLRSSQPVRIPEFLYYRPDGEEIYVEASVSRVKTPQHDLFCIMARNVTDRHRVEQQLHMEVTERLRAEANYRSIFENAAVGIFQATLAGRYTIVNPEMARIFGYPSPEVMVAQIQDIATQTYVNPARRQEVIARGLETDGFVELESEYRRADGSTFTGQVYFRVVRDESGQVACLEGFLQDVTARKRSEQAIRESEERYRDFYNKTPVMLHSIDRNGRLVSVSDYWLEVMGYNRDEVIGRPLNDFLTPESRTFANQVVLPEFFFSGSCQNVPYQVMKKNGEVIDILLSAVSELDPRSGSYRSLAVLVDVTERKRVEQQLQMQLRRMASLRAVEMSITSRMDLRNTLGTLLEQVTAHLGVDAACVLLLNPRTQLLEDAADCGFRFVNVKSTRLRLGEGLAGKVALDRRLITANNLGNRGEAELLIPALVAENFTFYCGVPLVVKGNVKGVLEVFHRGLLQPQAEWMEFLEALAGQAAIAIDNIALYEEQQRANQKLTEAYDATIEGWSKALELRDQETEGHTQRVTRLTIELARAMGVNEDEMVNYRRGALLHDIGKMGIPDSILLKPGPLTAEEWQVMRRHPDYAYEWLSEIEFVRPALDIPWCHHERWDGTGYPRGLKGNQIPLAARIFAVIDVYDSLSCDRPYRSSLPPVEVHKYLREQAGTQFDPVVVTTFLGMIENKSGWEPASGSALLHLMTQNR